MKFKIDVQHYFSSVLDPSSNDEEKWTTLNVVYHASPSYEYIEMFLK